MMNSRSLNTSLSKLVLVTGALVLSIYSGLQVVRQPLFSLVPVGLLVLGLLIRYPVLGLYAIVALLPFESVTIPGTNITAARVVGLLTFLAWGLDFLMRRRNLKTLFANNHQLRWGVLFVAWAVASLSWSTYKSVAMNASASLFQLLGLYLIAVDLLKTEARLRDVAIVWTFAGIASGVLGMALGWQTTSQRLIGGMGNPNGLAGQLVPLMGFVVLFFLRARSRLLKLFWSAAGLLIVWITLFTASRTGILALTVVLLSCLSLLTSTFQRIRFILIMAALGAFLLSLNAVVVAQNRLALDAVADQLTGVREELLRAGLSATADHLLLGVGVGNHIFLLPAYQVSAWTRAISFADGQLRYVQYVHNAWVGVAMELGIVGLLLFAAIVISGIARAWKVARGQGPDGGESLSQWARAVLVTLSGYLVFSMFGNIEYEKATWLVLALTYAVGNIGPTPDLFHASSMKRPGDGLSER